MNKVVENPSLVHSAKLRRFQYRLPTLLAVTAAAAVLLGYLYFYRSLTVKMVVRFATIDDSAAKSLLAANHPNSIESSKYQWLILDDKQLTDLLQVAGKPASILGTTTRTISTWPRTAFVGAYHHVRPEIITINEHLTTILHEAAELHGYIGSRRAGTQNQFRVECEIDLQHPSIKQLSAENPQAKIKTKEKLFYEGVLPTDHLVFLAPIDDDSFSVVIFDVK